MEEFKVRPATLSDLDTLLGFEQEIIRAERPFDPTIREGEISYYDIKDLILSQEAEVLVAEVDGKIVASGYAKIKRARHYLDHERYSYLGFMYTAPEYRGRGLNGKIVDGLREWSYKRDIKEVRLTVYQDNIGAIKAYGKVGFKKHLVEMRLVDDQGQG
ncbi:GNAT family N-acetyltransferase [Pseudozobellia thermophila]|uniref:Ribosomal protein S18 acetylase RimI n=1 Tax=Pseudozobellia thermophila TaxID=192903 RepID=A0A1M6JV95_9FLAO|nr:GNAT family N-acetyltransferase [Pseudozobellia thermophila]SHJ50542.1 Ribosomal protein S18 acetylase RimI [Pseudozobellia thermophila]